MASSTLWSRIAEMPEGPVLVGSGVGCAEVEDALRAGEAIDEVVRARGLEPADAIAAVVRMALGPDGSEGLPLVHGRPRWDSARAIDDRSLEGLLPDHVVRSSRFALAAGLLQVLDFWDLSHDAAQRSDDLGDRRFSLYWHAIAHRREPDHWNASYWFRRVGSDPLIHDLDERVAPLLEESPETPGVDALRNRTDWNIAAFLDLCNDAKPGSEAEALARRIQRVEMILLLEATWDSIN